MCAFSRKLTAIHIACCADKTKLITRLHSQQFSAGSLIFFCFLDDANDVGSGSWSPTIVLSADATQDESSTRKYKYTTLTLLGYY